MFSIEVGNTPIHFPLIFNAPLKAIASVPIAKPLTIISLRFANL